MADDKGDKGEALVAKLFDAAKAGDAAALAAALEDGKAHLNIDTTDKHGWTALHYACKVKDEDESAATVKVLIENGANVTAADMKGAQPLHIAAESGHVAVLSLLLDGKENKRKLDLNPIADAMDVTPLLVAAKNNKNEAVKFLVEAGADLAITDCLERDATALTVSNKLKEWLKEQALARK